MTSRISDQSQEVSSSSNHLPKSNQTNSTAYKTTLLMLATLSLASNANAKGYDRECAEKDTQFYIGYTPIQVGNFCRLDMPTGEVGRDIYKRCLDSDNFYYVSRICTTTAYFKANEQLKEQFYHCGLTNVDYARVACITDQLIDTTLDPTDYKDPKFKDYLKELQIDKFCKSDPAPKNFPYCNEFPPCGNSEMWYLPRAGSKQMNAARIKFLEDVSERKKYFKSHVACLKNIEERRTKWQCRNLAPKCSKKPHNKF